MGTKGIVADEQDIQDISKHMLATNRQQNNANTWRFLYGQNQMQAQQLADAYTSQYNEIVDQAYSQKLANDRQVFSSQLGTEAQQALLDVNQSAASAYYNKFSDTFMTNLAKIEADKTKADAEVSAQLYANAEYSAKYRASTYDYLKRLWDDNEANQGNLFDKEELSMYLRPDTEINGYRLATWDELKRGTNADDALFDSDGNITVRGMDFFDKMQNLFVKEDGNEPLSFNQFLKETDKDLFDWSQSFDAYNYNETGKNRTSVNNMLGIDDDNVYGFIERWGGLTSNEIGNMFSRFENTIDGADFRKHPERAQESLRQSYNDLQSYANKLGLHDDATTKEALETLHKGLNSILQNDSDFAATGLWDIFAGGVAGLGVYAAAAGVGAKIAGSSLALAAANPVTAAVGVVLIAAGALAGGIYAGVKIDKAKKENEQQVNDMRDAYNSLLAALANQAKITAAEKQDSLK